MQRGRGEKFHFFLITIIFPLYEGSYSLLVGNFTSLEAILKPILFTIIALHFLLVPFDFGIKDEEITLKSALCIRDLLHEKKELETELQEVSDIAANFLVFHNICIEILERVKGDLNNFPDETHEHRIEYVLDPLLGETSALSCIRHSFTI